MSDNMLTIGQLAKRAGVTIRTLRYYDKIGLIVPSDYKEGGHRLYSIDDLIRLQQIQSLKFIGFSLKDINNLLELSVIEEHDLTRSIAFKKRELIAEQERILQMIDQLDHMTKIITGYEKIDVKLFCFIIHSILFEEENLNEAQEKGSIHNFRSEARVKIDKAFFSMFMQLKKLVENDISPESEEAFHFCSQLTNLTNEMLSTMEMAELKSALPFDEFNILNPLTDEESTFLKDAFAYMSKKFGSL